MRRDGLVLGFSVYENTIMEKYRTEEFSPGGRINRKKMRSFAEELIKAYDVRPEDCGPRKAGALSGGNQQKIIIGREIAQEPKILIAIQPTRGLDVGAIENVHKMLISERDKGVAVLLISFELDEVMNVSDRIAVIYDGHIQQIFEHGTVDNRTLGRVMAGGEIEDTELEEIKKKVQAEKAAEAAGEDVSKAEPAAEVIPVALSEETAEESAAEAAPAETAFSRKPRKFRKFRKLRKSRKPRKSRKLRKSRRSRKPRKSRRKRHWQSRIWNRCSMSSNRCSRVL